VITVFRLITGHAPTVRTIMVETARGVKDLDTPVGSSFGSIVE
jgi:hypothetical protein